MSGWRGHRQLSEAEPADDPFSPKRLRMLLALANARLTEPADSAARRENDQVVATVTLPAFLANALVNRDTSGLNASERACLKRVEALLGKGRVVDVVRDENGEPPEPRVTWSFKLYSGDTLGGEVIDYVCHRAAPGEINRSHACGASSSAKILRRQQW
jgi:hypothetical protein